MTDKYTVHKLVHTSDDMSSKHAALLKSDDEFLSISLGKYVFRC